MAKRRTELSTDVVMNFRINQKMKEEIDKRADMMGVSSAEWMRRVLQEKIDGRADAELHDMIKDVVLEMKKEKII